MFEKLKLKKKLKKQKKMFGEFITKPDVRWFESFGFDFDIMRDADIKSLSGNEDLIKLIRNWYVYKDIKALSLPGDVQGAEYIRYYDRCLHREFPCGEGKYEEATGIRGGYHYYYGTKCRDEPAEAILEALKADDSFWLGKKEPLDNGVSPFPILYDALEGAVEPSFALDEILLWPLKWDSKAFFEGSSAYVKFFRSLLKAYKTHGKSPLWKETIKRLTWPEVYDQKEHKRTRTCSVLCARFPDFMTEELKSKGWVSDSSETGFMMYGVPLMGYAAFIEEKVEQYILFNDEYWNCSVDGAKFQEIWDYYGMINEDAYCSTLRSYEKQRKMEEAMKAGEKEDLPPLE